tara:strand:- start:2097 stop:2402 length:306 start_codon:yes stop_codon:yes gene_type:complete
LRPSALRNKKNENKLDFLLGFNYLVAMNRSLEDEIEELSYEARRIVSTLNDLPAFGEQMEDWEAEYRAELIDHLNEVEVALEEINTELADQYYERVDPRWN